MLESLGDFFAENALATILSAIIAYLLGSINFAIIITGLFIKKDIRTMGSGNAGMTNVFRSVGKAAGVLTLIGDFLKGVVALLIARAIYINLGGDIMKTELGMNSPIMVASYLSGFFCLLGHLFPLYFGFRGGKGILTTAGMLAIIDWRILLILLTIFIIVFIITRIVSISSIIAVTFLPIFTFLFAYFHPFSSEGMGPEYVALCTALALLFAITIIIMHKDNIKRLRNGTEKKFSFKKN